MGELRVKRSRVQIPAARPVKVQIRGTGAFVLHAAGMLEGKPATTHWEWLDNLRDLGVEVRDERFVDAGQVITSAGISAGIDMALHLVARLDSVEKAKRVRRYLQYDPAPPV
jgi:transcriptional regulator GlxA family with amidase domain